VWRPVGASCMRVTCTCDWTQLTDEMRLPRARATTADRLQASLDRLATLAEGSRLAAAYVAECRPMILLPPLRPSGFEPGEVRAVGADLSQ
jgi:hypothetical protein